MTPLQVGGLLSCPFCNSRVMWIGAFPDNRIECEQCSQAVVKAQWYDGDLGTAELAWNTRAPTSRVGNDKA